MVVQPVMQPVYVQPVVQPVYTAPQTTQSVVVQTNNTAPSRKKNDELTMAIIINVIIFLFCPWFCPCSLIYLVYVAAK